MPNADQQLTKLITAALANVTGAAYVLPKGKEKRTFSATVDGTGAVTATVAIQGSNDGVNWNVLGTITLTDTTTDTDGFASDAPWPQIRAVLSNLTGTGAVCTVTMGI